MYKITLLTRTKSSIRYAKENDKEKREKERERKKGRRRDIEREGEIREREREGGREGERERLMTSPNYVTRACKKERGRVRSLFERKILVKSPEPENKAQRKVKTENPRE